MIIHIRYIAFLIFAFCFFKLGAQDRTIRQPEDPYWTTSMLSKAHQLRMQGDLEGAIHRLDSILIRQADNQEALIFKGDLYLQAKKFKQASQLYKQLILITNNPIQVYINMSYALFMDSQPVQAIEYARKAYEIQSSNPNTITNYFNAMLWNRKIQEAKSFFEENQHLLPANNRMILQARLLASGGNFPGAINEFDRLIQQYPEREYIREYLEVLGSRQEHRLAKNVYINYFQAFTVEEQRAFESNFDLLEKQNLGSYISYFSDNGGNQHLSLGSGWASSPLKEIPVRIQYGFSTIHSPGQDNSNYHFLNLALKKKWLNRIDMEIQGKLMRMSTPLKESALTFQTRQSVLFKPHDRWTMGLHYKSYLLEHTAFIMSSKIRERELGLSMNWMPFSNAGIYLNSSRANLSDGNRKTHLFVSAYHLLNRKPLVKTGYNFSMLMFDINEPDLAYFSPRQYQGHEIYAELDKKNMLKSGFDFMVQGALGYQRFDNSDWEPTYRIQTSMSYLSGKIHMKLQYKYSNAVNAYTNGYSFHHLELNTRVSI